jgi:RNA polymerase sigma factor (sigma-70 family)
MVSGTEQCGRRCGRPVGEAVAMAPDRREGAEGPPRMCAKSDEDLLDDFYRRTEDDREKLCEDAFKELCDRHRDELIAFLVALHKCRWEDAEDAVQLAFLKVARTRKTGKARFERGKGTVRAWLRKIAGRCLLEILRPRSGQYATRTGMDEKTREEFDEKTKTKPHLGPAAEAITKECWNVIMACKSNLRTRLRRVFDLFFLHNRTLNQIAEELRMTYGTAGRLKHEARKLVESCLRRKGFSV